MTTRRRSWAWVPLFLFGIFVCFWLATRWLDRALLGGGAAVSSGSVLQLTLSGPLVERSGAVWGSTPVGPLSIRELDAALRNAAQDDRIVAARIDVGALAVGFAKAQDIRSALRAFRDAGKPVVARVEIGTLLDLYVATAADTVVQVPTGMWTLGLLARTQYYGALLERIGVQFEVFHTGPYKTAMEPFTSTEMSEPERQVVESLLDSLYGQIVEGIAADRELSRDQVAAAIDRGLLSAEEAHAAGLVDELAFDDRVRELLEQAGARRPDAIGARDYAQESGSGLFGGGSRPVIALVHVDGMIVPGEPDDGLLGDGFAGGDAVARALRAAREAADVRAVVLRIDSPGGAVSASDVIWKEAKLTAERKPLIVSMSDVAASGGYWIATAGTRILAAPGTYTGSIGVVSGRVNIAGAYEKLGIGNSSVKRGRNADLFLESQPLTEEQREILSASLEASYRLFLGKVAAARQMEHAEVERLAAGRVWTGEQAREVNLVDELGGIVDAIAAARQHAGLRFGTPVSLRVYPEPRGIFEVIGSLLSNARSAPLPAAAPGSGEAVTPAALRAAREILARLHAAGYQWALSLQPLPTPSP